MGVDRSRETAGGAARYLPALAQVAVEALAAGGFAVVAAALWSAFGAIGFGDALARTSFVTAGFWVFAGGTLLPRLPKLDHMRWGVAVVPDELVADSAQPPPVVLTPLASSVVVALLLIGLGTLLY